MISLLLLCCRRALAAQGGQRAPSSPRTVAAQPAGHAQRAARGSGANGWLGRCVCARCCCSGGNPDLVQP